MIKKSHVSFSRVDRLATLTHDCIKGSLQYTDMKLCERGNNAELVCTKERIYNELNMFVHGSLIRELHELRDMLSSVAQTENPVVRKEVWDRTDQRVRRLIARLAWQDSEEGQ